MSIDFDSLSDDDQNRIAAFLRTADKLRKSDLFKDGLFAMKYHLKVDNEKRSVEEHCDRPPEKDVRDALLDIRKFVSQSESIFFYSVCNCIYQFLNDSIARQNLASVRNGFKDSLAGLEGASTINIRLRQSDNSEPKSLKPEQIIDLYFNSNYFHADLEKITQLTKLRARIGAMLEYSFLEALRNIASCVFYLAALVRREFSLPEELQK